MPDLPHRIQRSGAGLLIVDLQERLLPVIHQKERVLQNALRLTQSAIHLGLPILVTEQYPKGIGRTVPEIASLLPTVSPMEKLAFSACGASGFLARLASQSINQLVVCGIESHVCICQTALDLLEHGLKPFVVADAVSSRTAENHRMGLDRMRDAGALLVSTEMILFELLQCAGAAEFKQILALVK